MTAEAHSATEGDERRIAAHIWRWYSVFFLAFLAYPLGELIAQGGTLRIAAGIAVLAAFCAVDIAVPSVALAGGHARWWPLPAMLALFGLFALLTGASSSTLLIFVAATGVSIYPTAVGLGIAAAVSGLAWLLWATIPSWHTESAPWGVVVPIVFVTIMILGIRRNARSESALLQAHSEIRSLAAEQERLRIARDIHDLLGHALTAIVVKADLAHRLVDVEPRRAGAEIAEVAALARQSLADVRSTVSGYREVSLLAELATAREVLRAAGIDAELPASAEQIRDEDRELLAWALREAVTNAVRHSRAGRVTVRFVGDGGIEIVDDGDSGGCDVPGNGLRGLAERVAAEGGRLTAGPNPGGGWRLAVDL